MMLLRMMPGTAARRGLAKVLGRCSPAYGCLSTLSWQSNCNRRSCSQSVTQTATEPPQTNAWELGIDVAKSHVYAASYAHLGEKASHGDTQTAPLKEAEGAGNESDFLYVAQESQCNALLELFAGESLVGVDTEFSSFPSFSETLQLIQIGGRGRAHERGNGQRGRGCVDAASLGKDGLARLIKDLFTEKTIVVHSYPVDLKLLCQASGDVAWRPAGLFDTQVAANLLGIGNTPSLLNLIENQLHVTLDKSQSLTDWRLRPLSKAQLSYAMGDIDFLLELHDVLTDQLRSRGREAWMHEEMTSVLAQPIPADLDSFVSSPKMTSDENSADVTAWLQLKRLHQISGSAYARAIAKHVAAWRNRVARERMVSPMVIMRDDTILSIAKGKASDLASLQTQQRINWSLFYFNLTELQHCIDSGIAEVDALGGDDADPSLVPLPPHMKLTFDEASKAELLALQALGVIGELCQKHGISPNAIISWEEKFLLGPWLLGHVETSALALSQGWRKAVVGDALELLKKPHL